MNHTARTRTFALLGDPVAHSLSPRLHNAAFLAAGIDAVYVALRCADTGVVATMRTIAASGGGGNVTIPHKVVAAACASPGSLAAEVGAVNTFVGCEGELVVTNTDIEGIVRSVGALAVDAHTWLVLGTGGSARAAVAAAMHSGARVCCASRDAARGAAFLEWSQSLGAQVADRDECVVVINATPLGLHDGDALPINPADLPTVRGALDLTYRMTGTTEWCRAWQTRGIPVLDGREPLLHQAAGSWGAWMPGVTPPFEVMRAVLHGHLG